MFRLNLQEEESGVKETGAVAMETDIEIKQEPIEPRPQNEVITIDIDDDIILIDTDTTMKYLSGEFNASFTRNEICPVTQIRSRYYCVLESISSVLIGLQPFSPFNVRIVSYVAIFVNQISG